VATLWPGHNKAVLTCAIIMFLYITESDRKQEGDGFDQVGTNPCNSKCGIQFLLLHIIQTNVLK